MQRENPLRPSPVLPAVSSAPTSHRAPRSLASLQVGSPPEPTWDFVKCPGESAKLWPWTLPWNCCPSPAQGRYGSGLCRRALLRISAQTRLCSSAQPLLELDLGHRAQLQRAGHHRVPALMAKCKEPLCCETANSNAEATQKMEDSAGCSNKGTLTPRQAPTKTSVHSAGISPTQPSLERRTGPWMESG